MVMTILKFITVLVSAVAPLFVLVRDWKFHDKRTRRHHKITRAIIGIWCIGSIGAAIFVTYDSSQIEELQERIAKLQRESSETRENTESIKHSVQQRGITKEQQIALSDALSKMSHKQITIIAVSGDSEAKNYATDFRSIFHESGWKTNLSEAVYPALDKDLVLFYRDANDLEICKEIEEAFRSNRIIVQILRNRGASISFGQDNLKPKLVVGHKAN